MTTESPRWFKSSYSNNGGNCIEIATNLVVAHGVIPVRDSKDPNGPELRFTPDAWRSFVATVKHSPDMGV
ncbi:DUF397 domain-containing protein [Streptomyces sp. URMC 123]|uniref:DUF397 domain-containing protein n=1 Tax=Streptomyces sp. URMC 123 TaxID=3423403 RepID=UPI003F19EDE5